MVGLVVGTAVVVGVNMAAYAKIPIVKKTVDDRLDGPLPPEVYDIYRRYIIWVPTVGLGDGRHCQNWKAFLGAFSDHSELLLLIVLYYRYVAVGGREHFCRG